MAGLTRRRFILLSAVALVGAAACSAPQETGLRGNGTVLYPRESEPEQVSSAPSESQAEPTPIVVPTSAPAPTPASEPIIAPDALPPAIAGGTDAEMHVGPVPSGKPPIAAGLPPRRSLIPSVGLESKRIQQG